jgi:diguanylate cyclase (GGDEF)-like protein
VEAEDKLAHNALHDALTGLPNRRLFLDRLQRSFAQAQRAADYHYAVLLADIDNFKTINHNLGSAAGDRALIEIGNRLHACLRETDFVSRDSRQASPEIVLSRLGGDEFALLLEGCSDPTDVLRIAERFQAAVAAPLRLEQGPIDIRLSIGIALPSGPQESAEDPLRDAETALRRAQAMGGARSELFDPAMHKRAVSRLKLEAELRTALNRNQFRVVYQPVFRLEPRQVIGFDALLRWQHPAQGLISPQEFLAAAEDTGLMAMIDQWVIREACRHLREWISSRANQIPLRISVNLSARHFASPQLIDGIKSCLRDVSIPPNTLQIEVSEQIAAANPELTANMFAQLKRLNVVTAVDDFSGTHCPLALLCQLSPEIVKIDHHLIAQMLADRTSHDLVDAIFLLARKLNSEIIAEGVERPAQLHTLQKLGCNLAQGYFFSPPVTADVARQFLQKSQTSNKTHPPNVLSS